MLEILDLTSEYKDEFIDMVKKFYTSEAVMHGVDEQNILNAYDAFINKKDESIRILILKEGLNVVGYSVLALYHSLEAGGKVLWIEEIFLKEEYRGHGYFSQYFKFIEKEYSYVKRIRLEATAENDKAIKMYLGKGFKEFNYLQFAIEK